jgi:hypothetical protein
VQAGVTGVPGNWFTREDPGAALKRSHRIVAAQLHFSPFGEIPGPSTDNLPKATFGPNSMVAFHSMFLTNTQ